jgi:phage-related protein
VANVEAVVSKSVVWVRSSKEDLKEFPEPVQKSVGYALWFAQIGSKHPHAKVLRGFGSAGVVEIIEDWDGDAYRAVYTVKFSGCVYVLHCFQKKSRRGAETPSAEIVLIKSRLRIAEADYQNRKEAELWPRRNPR